VAVIMSVKQCNNYRKEIIPYWFC